MSKLYRWQAQDAQGQVQRGHLHSAGPQMAQLQLMRQGLQQVRLQRSHMWLLSPVRARDITLLTRQLATLLAAGLPLLQALHLLGQGLQHPRLQDLLQQLRSSLESGLSLSAACAQHPRYFSEVYVQLVAAGEQGGLLDVMLARLATHLESTQALQAKVRAALTYPAAVLLVAAVVVSILMVKVVPTFGQVFANQGAALPWPTLLVMGMSDWLQAYGLWLVLAMPLLAVVIQRVGRQCPACRDRVARWLLRWPLLGPLMLQTCITRWTRTLATLCTAGVPLVQALASAGQAAGHVVFDEASELLMRDIAQGQALSQAMSGLQLYPPMVLQLCAVGEASGTLDEMLAKAADFLDVQVQTRLASLMSLLEPALMVVLGSLIGGMVVAMYLPIFNMGQVI